MPLQCEARLVAAHAPGGAPWQQGAGHSFAIAETQVVRAHAHDAIMLPGTDPVDVARRQPLLDVFRHYVAAGADLGKTFKAEV